MGRETYLSESHEQPLVVGETVAPTSYSENAESVRKPLRRQGLLRISVILGVWNCSWGLGIMPVP